MLKDNKKVKKVYCIIICLTLSLITVACSSEKSNNSNYEYFVEDADVFIDVPTLRQYGDYSCGTTCVQMIMNYLHPYECDLNLTQYEKDLKTDKQEGTSSDNIKAYFDNNDVVYSEREEISTDELIDCLNQNRIVLMCIQAWSSTDDGSYNTDNPDRDDYLIEGHWVICVGYKKDKDSTLFYFNDPACVGHCVMNEEDLAKRWIDMDGQGNIYNHYGLIITGTDSYCQHGAYYLY